MTGLKPPFLPFLWPPRFKQSARIPRRPRSINVGVSRRQCRCNSTNNGLSQQQQQHHDAQPTDPLDSASHNQQLSSTPSPIPTLSSPPFPTSPSFSHLDPSPSDYATTPFLDRCRLIVHSGSGGHGCVSFLREKFIPDGPPNGGDGGTGGSVFIQAIEGETSLHKLARRGIIKAGRGKNGRGKSKGGERGEDVLVKVPVGTVVREIWRHDPVALAEEEEERLAEQGQSHEGDPRGKWRRDKWIIYPGSLPSDFVKMEFPAPPRTRRSSLTAAQLPAPIFVDLDQPMERPTLLAVGAMGGLGNPHFATRNTPRPKFATKGESGIRIDLELELKILADVGLVGLPNAGKSTLLRSLSNSRSRVGDWAFTTLQPNIGTVVLDNHRGRPAVEVVNKRGERRTNFTIADIPGLIEDAHLDKGLGLDFLRHIERARVLAFVVDLGKGNAVEQLKDLWREIGEYEVRRDQELNARTEERIPAVDIQPTFGHAHGSSTTSAVFQDIRSRGQEDHHQDDNDHDDDDRMLMSPRPGLELAPLKGRRITSKPWFIIGTKADLEGTRENFGTLKRYLERVEKQEEPHPSGRKNAWVRRLEALPVCAIRGEGVERLPGIVVPLLDE